MIHIDTNERGLEVHVPKRFDATVEIAIRCLVSFVC